MPSLRRSVLGILAGSAWIVVASVAPAQKPADSPLRELGHWGGSAGPEAPSPVGFRIDFGEQAALAAADSAGAAWTGRRPGWRILYDPRTRLPWRAYGPGIVVAPPEPDAAAVREAAEAVALSLHAELGLPGDAPVFRYAALAGGLWYVSFEQRLAGVRVEDAGLSLRIDRAGRLVLFGARWLPVGGVPARGDLRPEDAVFAALASLRGEGWIGPSARPVPGPAEAVIHAPLAGDGRTPAPAYRVRISTEAPLGEWVVYVDARTGAVRDVWNDVRFIAGRAQPPHLLPRAARRERGGPGGPGGPSAPSRGGASFSATANGLVHENVAPDQPAVSAAFPDCTFTVVDGTSAPVTATTDASGSFSFAGGPGSAAVSSGLDGVWITTNNVAGAQAAYATTVGAGVPALVATFDDTNWHQAERDAFFFGTRARNNVLLHNPTETLFNVALPANVNLAQTCNAYYNGSSINFFLAGGGCINTAYSDTVVEHEYGHHVTNVIYAAHGRSVPGHLGEGYSDAQAASCEDTNLIGFGFSGPGTLIRNLVNTCQWPASCGTGVHARGRVVGGSFWDARVQFATAYGPAGKTQIDQYLYAHFHGAPLTETEAFLEFLVLDDDDANVANGTPNFAKFLFGFTTSHGVPCPIPLATVTHYPLGPTANQLHPYQIHATAVPILGGSTTTASVVWSVNGGAPTVAPMTFSGFDWSASIPVVATPAAIEYYLAFADASGGITLHPPGAPSEKFVFRNYRPETFYFDGFETAAGWTSAGTGQDDWNRQAPGNPTHAYDPPAAYAGVACAGNDLSSPGFNGNYRFSVDNSYTSPPINCAGRTGVFLRYRRWLTVEDALYDQARIEVSVGGGPFVQVWQNLATAGGVDHHLDRAWIDHHVRLAAADGQASVQVRFRLTSDAGLEFGGWTIDDVALDAVPASPILTATGPLTAGSTLTLGVGGVPGEPYALGLDLAAPGVFVPFVGTLASDPFGPTFLMLVAPGADVVAPSGRSFLPLPVPPGIAGFTVFGTAVVFPLDGTPIVVGNAAAITFL